MNFCYNFDYKMLARDPKRFATPAIRSTNKEHYITFSSLELEIL